MPGGIGPLELGIVLLIILLVFGPKRLPGLGRQLGSGMREFKESITGPGKGDDEDADADRPALKQATPVTTAETTRVAPAEQPAEAPVPRDPQT